MKKTIISLVAAGTIAMIVGCGSTGNGKAYQTQPVYDNSQDNQGATQVYGDAIIVTAEGDASIKSVTTTENGVYVDCGGGGCGDVLVGNEITTTTTTTEPDVTTMPIDGNDSRDGTYQADDGASWDQDTCNEHGYFFCTDEMKCLDKPLFGEDAGTCGGM